MAENNTAQGSPWDQGPGAHSAKVSLGTHSLHLSSSGVTRLEGSPIVLIITGLASTSYDWVAVRKYLDPFVRNMIYDRSGYGESERNPMALETTSAIAVADELKLLLEVAGVQGPFIILCHSWGGIIAREFLALMLQSAKADPAGPGEEAVDQIVGMVFVDANQERSAEVGNFTAKEIQNIIKDIDYHTVVGNHKNHKLTAEEWRVVLAAMDTEIHCATEAAEMGGAIHSYKTLGEKKQLEQKPPLLRDHPIAVLQGNTGRDFQAMYDAGVKLGAGTEADRKFFRETIAGWEATDSQLQSEILQLSTKGRLVRAMNSGHNVQLTEPELVAEQVKWVLENL